MDLLRKNKTLLAITCCAFVFRMTVFFVIKPYNQYDLQNKIMRDSDSEGFHNRAVSILETRSFSSFMGLRTPGYPLFISLFYFIFGVKPWVVLFIQILLGVGIVIMTYLIGKMLVSRKVALLATGLCAIDPHLIFYSVQLLSDILFVFVLLLSILFFIYGIKNKRLTLFLLSSTLLGVSTMVKPVTLYFPIIVAGAILLCPKMKFNFRLTIISFFILVFFVVIFPWQYRNYKVYNHFSLAPLAQSFNLLYRHAAFTEAAKTGKSIEQVRREFTREVQLRELNGDDTYSKIIILNKMPSKLLRIGGWNPFDTARVYNEIAINYLIKNWIYYLPLHLRGIAIIFLDPSTRNFFSMIGVKTREAWYLERNRSSANVIKMIVDYFRINSTPEVVVGILISIFFFIVYSSFFFGVFKMILEKKMLLLFFFLSIILYFPNMAGIMCENRYKLPTIPFYMIISARGIIEIFRLCKNRRGTSKVCLD